MQDQPDAQNGSQRIAISGSSGLIGGSLAAFLSERGYHVRRLVRSLADSGPDTILWDPGSARIDAAALEAMNAVVHLAGENIAAGRWTDQRREAIRRSRVDGTQLLCEALASLERKPRVLVAASAIGYYGDRGDEVLSESSPPGRGFLPDVCRQWEQATEPAAQAGIRVVNLRISMVLSASGGALSRMIGPFRLGAGGVLGNGRQYISWIALDDLLGAILHAIFTEELSGPVNAVAPHAVTNRELTKTLGRVLKRPTLARMPAFMVRTMFGQMGNDLLLASTRVAPAKLEATGFEFLHPNLEQALRAELGR